MKNCRRNTKLSARLVLDTTILKSALRSLLLLTAMFVCNLNSTAQLCNGSLGDPIVNITFGAGPNPGPTLSAIGSGYSYRTDDCPNDGMYAIRNATTACYSSSWHSLNRDHTGDPQGYFMLVNASYDPGDFYVDTVRNLCANTDYEFAAWVLNIMNRSNSIMPNLTFRIEMPDGTVLKQMNTGDLPVTGSPQWKQYGFEFSIPPGVQKVVLRITNNAPGGIGNDLALDDITFRPCGPEVKASILGDGETLDLCEDEARIFTLTSAAPNSYESPFYQWQISTDTSSTWNDIPGANNLSFDVTPKAVGTYQYRLTVAEVENASLKPCRVSSNKLIIAVHPLPEVKAGPDRRIIKGETTTLDGTVNGENVTYSWSPALYLNDPNSLVPEVSATEDMLYTLAAQTAYGCTDNDVVRVQVANDLYVPNAFTPNSDGNNDTWRIPFLDPYLGAEVTVYNRYGQMVYHSVGALVSWDGSYRRNPLPVGTYVYVIQIKKWQKTVKGTVTIIR